MIIFSSASFFSSSAMRTSSVDRSRTSSSWGSLRLRTTSAIRSTSCDLFTMYGTLSMKIVFVDRVSGPMSHVPRSRIDPDPVLYTCLSSSAEFRIWPPVGKSGPLI